MRLSQAAWPVLFVLATPGVQAALTVADCAVSPVAVAVETSSDCVRLESQLALYAQPVRTVLPDPQALDAILVDIGHVEQPMSLWQRFTGWMGDRLRELWDALPDVPKPLRDLQVTWPAWLADTFLWAGAILLAGAVLAAVVAMLRVREGRSPGILQRVIGARRPCDPADPAPCGPSLNDLGSASPAEQPRILLAVVIGTLRAAGRIGSHAALSHRQLGAAVREVTPGQRADIESLAGLAERVTYSDFVPDDPDLARAERVARELVAGVSQ